MSSARGKGRLTRRDLLCAAFGTTVGVAAGLAPLRGSHIPYAWAVGAGDSAPTVVVRWNNAALQAIRDTKPGPPMVARALAIVHTCIYDAWAAYDPVAVPTMATGIAKVKSKRSNANKMMAISYAAYKALADLFPAEVASLFNPLMASLGYPIDTATMDTTTPTGIGNACAQAVITFRHGDWANQLGTLSSSGIPYADYTGYVPVNTPTAIHDPTQWQPLSVGGKVQIYIGPFWGRVLPFALTSGAQFRPAVSLPPCPSDAYTNQAVQMLGYSANLTDTQKVIAEYWKDGPHSELPPGHWNLFGQVISQRDKHDLDDDVRMFFSLANAVFDAGIAAWDAKRVYNSVRPITAIHYLFDGRQVRAWAGPCQGTQLIDGGTWQPYQPASIVTPPFPEFVSGHSTFSAAAAEVLKRFTGSDAFGYAVTFPAGSSSVEPGCTPASPVTLSWDTFSAAADQAGLSRRYGGIHFEQGDLAGRVMGRLVGAQVWTKAQAYITGAATS